MRYQWLCAENGYTPLETTDFAQLMAWQAQYGQGVVFCFTDGTGCDVSEPMVEFAKWMTARSSATSINRRTMDEYLVKIRELNDRLAQTRLEAEDWQGRYLRMLPMYRKYKALAEVRGRVLAAVRAVRDFMVPPQEYQQTYCRTEDNKEYDRAQAREQAVQVELSQLEEWVAANGGLEPESPAPE